MTEREFNGSISISYAKSDSPTVKVPTIGGFQTTDDETAIEKVEDETVNEKEVVDGSWFRSTTMDRLFFGESKPVSAVHVELITTSRQVKIAKH